MAQGGYQAPAQPAAMSGEGANSRRTDGAPGDTMDAAQQYALSQQAEARGVPTVDTNKTSPATTGQQVGQLSPIVPANAPTSRPLEDVMTGVNMYGQGKPYSIDSEADRERKAKLLGMLQSASNNHDVSNATRAMIMRLRAEV